MVSILIPTVLWTVGAAFAQPNAPVETVAQEWQVVEQARGRDLAAYTAFSNGVVIIARCNRGGYEATINGLPADEGEGGRRQVRIGIGEPGRYFTSWFASQGGESVFSPLPAMFARQIREGGELNVTVEGQDGEPNRRYVMELPPSPQAIDRTLELCDRPLVDPRDAMREADLAAPAPIGRTWTRSPRPDYPSGALSRRVWSGAVTISCLGLADGILSHCEVESEFPRDAGFGQAALRATRQARLTPQPDATPRLVTFPVIFSAR